MSTDHHDRPRLAIVPGGHDTPQPPPNDPDAERAVLGAMLQSKQAITDASLTLTGADFYQPRHELIYDTAIALYARLEPVDTITVADRLTANKDLTRIGGSSYLAELTTATPLTSNAGYYADIVAAHATRRRLAEAGTRISALAYRGDDAGEDDLLAEATTALARVPTSIPGVDKHTPTDTWAPVNLDDILAGNDTGPKATLLARRDGKLLLYPGAVHSISGEPGSGKTWAALVAVAQELEQHRPALFIDFEDRAQTVVARLRALGVHDTDIAAGLRYVRPDVALTPTGRLALQEAATDTTIAIIDGITEAMTMHGLSLMDNEDVARWLALVPRYLADLGPAVLQVDHVVKNADNRGRYAIGGQHKLAGITGVAYKMLTVKSFGKGVKGHAKIVIDKDKHGDVGPNGVTIADLTLDATAPDGSLYGWLDTPGEDRTPDGQWRPTGYMARVSAFLVANPAATGNEITRAVHGKRDHILAAVECLIQEGHVITQKGSNRAVLHYLEIPFEEDDA